MLSLWSPKKRKGIAELWESSSNTGSPDKDQSASSVQGPESPVPEVGSFADGAATPASGMWPSESKDTALTSLLGTIAWLIRGARRMALAQASFVWLLATVVSGITFFAGLSLFSFLVITRRYSPATLDYHRPLHFDYATKDGRAVAITPLVQGRYVGADSLLPALPGARFLPSGQQLELWIELRLPEMERNQGVFQLVGELLAADSRVVARSSRPFMLKHQSTIVKFIRTWFALPWAVLGLIDESVELQLQLFDAYEEREAYPVAYFRATMLPSASNSPLPLLYDAVVHIRLKLGVLQRILYWMRPSWLTSWMLALTATALLTGGSTCGLLLLGVAMLVAHIAKHNGQVEAPKSGAALTSQAYKELLKQVGMGEIEPEPAGDEEFQDAEGRDEEGNKHATEDGESSWTWVPRKYKVVLLELGLAVLGLVSLAKQITVQPPYALALYPLFLSTYEDTSRVTIMLTLLIKSALLLQ